VPFTAKEQSPYLLQRRWVRWTLYLALMTLLGFVNTGQSYSFDLAQGRITPFAFWPTLVLGVSDWYLWAAWTPAIIWLSHRYPFHPEKWLRSFFVHLACNLVFSFFVFAVTIPIYLWVSPVGRSPTFSFWLWVQGRANIYMVLYFWIYWAILGAILSTQYYQQFRDRELKASRLQAQLAQAQLQVLRMQLHPHFLFNTLNAISALLHKDVEKADMMIARLGELLRATLENAGIQEVPLRKELEFIEAYLEIEKARLGDRLQVRMDIDPEALDMAVPNFVLQPLVENAVRHGIAPLARVGRIDIRARQDNGMLRLEIQDNGPGLSAEQQAREEAGAGVAGPHRRGLGIANTRARLQQLYGRHHQFEMKNGPTQGLTVILFIPAQEEAEAEKTEATPSESVRPATIAG
jgi:two-component system, LytTR family, sensor kinase